MVGDECAADVAGAKDTGWQAIWFNPAGAACPGRQLRHVAEVASMADLPTALERLCASGLSGGSG